ncbi:MAG: CapA family protein [Acidiferrobacterales bacterium]
MTGLDSLSCGGISGYDYSHSMQAAQYFQRPPQARAVGLNKTRAISATGLRLFVLGATCVVAVACTSVSPTQPDERAPQPPPATETLPPATTTEAPRDEPAPVIATPSGEAAPPAGEAAPPQPNAPKVTAPPPARELRISAVGDIMLGGSAAPELAKLGYDYPFAEVRRVFQESHVVFGNLEGPLTDAGLPEPGKRYVFRSPPARVAPALAAVGFNVVALANNHTMDYGVEGLRQTMAALQSAGIQFVGAGENLRKARDPVIIKAGGHSVAFLAYSLTFPENFWARNDRAGTAFGHREHIRADVTAARERADVVIVSFHWGREITTALRAYQPQLARTAIDAGASVVLGHHPHILQAIELYKRGIILYSLGNFAFGSYSRNAARSMIAQLKIQNARLIEVKLVPINVNNIEVVFQPRLLYADDANEVIEGLRRLSEPLGTIIINHKGVGLVVLEENKGQRWLSKKNDARDIHNVLP